MFFMKLVIWIWTCSCMFWFSILSLFKLQSSISRIKMFSCQCLDDSAFSVKHPCTSQTKHHQTPNTAKQNTNQNNQRHAQETYFSWYSELGSNNRQKVTWNIEHWVQSSKQYSKELTNALQMWWLFKVMALGLTWSQNATTLAINFVN